MFQHHPFGTPKSEAPLIPPVSSGPWDDDFPNFDLVPGQHHSKGHAIDIVFLPSSSGRNATVPNWPNTKVTSTVLEQAKRDLDGFASLHAAVPPTAPNVVTAGPSGTGWKTYAMWTLAGATAVYAGIRLYQLRNAKTEKTETEGKGTEAEEVEPPRSQSWDGGEEPQGEVPESPLYPRAAGTQYDFVMVTPSTKSDDDEVVPQTQPSAAWLHVDAPQTPSDASASSSAATPMHRPNFTPASPEAKEQASGFDFVQTEEAPVQTAHQFEVVADEDEEATAAQSTASYSSSDGGSSLCPGTPSPALEKVAVAEQTEGQQVTSPGFLGGWTTIFTSSSK